ncbi:MAG TPA: hypothetical protein VHQ22_10205 [Terriglobales bacterium]|nr:hypothetical protein [Terriglobales bacterium]
MKRLAMRSVCNSDAPTNVFEVTKKVRGPSWMSQAVCVARGSCHGAGFYNISEGMSKLVYARFALLRASPAGSKERSLFASLRHG